MPKTRKNYSNEFKLQVINDRNSGMSLSSVAAKHSINTTQVHEWTRKYNEIGVDSFIDMRGKHDSPLRGRPKKNFKSIEEELEYTKLQNEYLKKRMAKQLNVDVDELGLPSLEDLNRH